MIFNNELDQSLYLMIESDKNNRKKVLEFLKSIPNELYQQLYIQLDKYREYEDRGIDILDRDTICLDGEYIDNNNFKYSFIIDMINHSLVLSRTVLINGMYKDEYSITIYAKSNYNNVDVFGRQILGSIYDCNKYDKNYYDLVDGMFGKMIVCSYNIFKIYRRVKLDGINRDINIDDLYIKKVKCRVRKMN